MTAQDSLIKKVTEATWIKLLSDEDKEILMDMIDSGEKEFLAQIQMILDDEQKQSKFMDLVSNYVSKEAADKLAKEHNLDRVHQLEADERTKEKVILNSLIDEASSL